ncbi:unnamed protein product, partial [Oppiella nova]
MILFQTILILLYIAQHLKPCTAVNITYDAKWESLDKRPLPGWYDEAKVGIFIHWGVFSVPAYNWQAKKQKNIVDFMAKNYKPDFTYQDFGPQFTAELWDPAKWVELFKAAGAKYVVMTTKHHEGFTMWPSKHSWGWNAVDIGPKRDLVGDLAAAVRKEGLKFGTYYSFLEFFNPLFLSDQATGYKAQDFIKYKMQPEIRELITNYKPDVVWADGSWVADDTYFESTDFLAWLYNDSPVKDTVVVNDRWGSNTPGKHGGFYNMADRTNPKILMEHKFENAMSMDRGAW